ncbi:tetratricopeptide repeat protein [Pseudanabaena minima]|uniref:tetratricopeptide repeat protein n=1 Tax=Pseudanabaena minima TaxID=890415 RepID=UPI003DA948D8
MSSQIPNDDRAQIVALLEQNQEVFKILLAFVQMSKGFKVAFAEINFPPDIDILITALQEHPKCQSIQFVVLRFDDPDLRFLLEAIKQDLAKIEIQPDKKLVLILQGLEKAIAYSGDNPPILTNLNYARDSFPVVIHHPVLFALPDYAVTRIAQFAPDFWAWTSATFKFQTPPETRDRLTAEVSNFSHNPNRYFAKPEQGERIDLLERLLQEYAEDTEASSRTRLELLNQLGKAHQSIREFDKAKFYFQQAIELCRELNFQNGEFEALYNLGVLCYIAREFENAKCYFNQSLLVKEQIGDKQGKANVYHCLGMAAQKLGEYAEAQQNYQQALAIKIEFGDLYSQGSTYAQLGNLELDLQKYTEAQHNYQKALNIFIEFDDYSSQANTYQSFGVVAQLLREYAESQEYYQKALANFIEFGDHYSQARVYAQLGLLAKAENNFTEAGQNLLQALEIFAQFQDQHNVEMTVNILSRIYQATQDQSLLEATAKVLGVTVEEIAQAFSSKE